MFVVRLSFRVTLSFYVALKLSPVSPAPSGYIRCSVSILSSLVLGGLGSNAASGLF